MSPTSRLLPSLLMACMLPASLAAQDVFRDPSQPRERRAADIVSRMTTAEKIAQMRHAAPAIPRLGIPAYNWWNEALHGVARNGAATVFPQAIALAATWDTPLVRDIADAISTEARAKHHEDARQDRRGMYQGLTFWSPNINIFRDPRWGRGQETYGEDPFLTARMGVAFVRGMQGDDPRYKKTIATPKHFAAHSGPESTRHSFDARPPEADLFDTYLPAFEACVREAGAGSVMAAYNRLDGVPCCANPRLLGGILRDRWGFSGYVVSDCGAVWDMYTGHRIVPTAEQASALAVTAGCDLTCGGEYDSLDVALAHGLVAIDDIDRSVRRLFAARIALGMFDPPTMVPYAAIPFSRNEAPEHDALARRAAVEGVVLLQNRGAVLPLSKSLTRVAVIGPYADNLDVLLGNYNGTPSHPVTILQGVRNALGDDRVAYAAGVAPPETADPADSVRMQADIAAAARLAASCDAVVLVAGISPKLEGEELRIRVDGFAGGDRTDLRLPKSERMLIEAVARAGRPTVLVLTGGSALAIPDEMAQVPAILMAWYPGQRGGSAVADVLFGDANPSGRLPVTVYASVADLPPFEDYSMRNRTYRYFTGQPLFAFGHGLSFTTFAYDSLIVPARAIAANDTARLRVVLRNTGRRDGDEVVQVYASRRDSRHARPVQWLVGFARVHIAAGAGATARIDVPAAALRCYDATRDEYAVEPGAYDITAGAASDDARLRTTLTIDSQR